MEFELPESKIKVKLADYLSWGHQKKIDELVGDENTNARAEATMVTLIERFGECGGATISDLRALDYHNDFLFLLEKVTMIISKKKT